ncbi:MAG: chromosome partitioning protein, partial [Verrucomicrobia bacterium 21-51-4]
MLSQTEIQTALKEVKYPGFSRDILSFGLIKSIEVAGNDVSISIAVTTADPAIPEKLKSDVEAAVSKVPGLGKLEVHMHATAPKGMPGQVAAKSTGGAAGVNGTVRHIIAIASGKGGVGKSTFAVNFACALAKKAEELGLKQAVGLLDCDIYGPSVPLMLGINERPNIDGHDLIPLEHFGLKVMSMGFLVDDDTPVV